MSKTFASIYDEYFHYDEIHSRTYGESRTCILMEVGSFFEIYTYKDPDGKIKHPKTGEISTLCNLNLVEKKATYRDPRQPILMMGFRNYMLDKYVQKLTQSNYTVAVYTQEKSGKDIIRKLSDIFSKGTFIPFQQEDETMMVCCPHHLVCIWIETYTPYKNPVPQIGIGISAIDVSTGHSAMFEYAAPFLMDPTTFDELERFISTFPPIETICISNLDEPHTQSILKYSGISPLHPIHLLSKEKRDTTEKVNNCTKQVYIMNAIHTYFRIPDLYYTCGEFQEYTLSTQSLCYLLDFVQEHDSNLISKIHPPTFSNTTDRVILANHTLRQLNIIEDSNVLMNHDQSGRLSSVLSFLNRCKTPMGRRMFERRLLNPTTNIQWLQEEYRMIARFKEKLGGGSHGGKNKSYQDIPKRLGGMVDIEKFARKLITKRIHPSSMFSLYQTLCDVRCIESTLKEELFPNNPEICVYLEGGSNSTEGIAGKLAEFLTAHFLIEECRGLHSSHSFEKTFIAPGVSRKLDDLVNEQKLFQEQFQSIHSAMNYWVGISIDGGSSGGAVKDKCPPAAEQSATEYLKIHQTEKSGMSLQLTKKRAATFKKWLAEQKHMHTLDIPLPSHDVSTVEPPLKIPIAEIKILHSTGSNDEIDFPFLSNLGKNMLHIQERISEQIGFVYREILQRLEDQFAEYFQRLSNKISRLDVVWSCSLVALENNYCMPHLDCAAAAATAVDTDDNTSGPPSKAYLQATKMRHCLIEHLNTQEIYVANDISLGIGDQDGVLLYGTNAIGKTSFIRSIGICVIMAQAGMFVPCETFLYRPYRHVFSRIIGNDNLFKGLSTFQVEMNELRVILRNSNEDSLILGDEVCSSTELESGLSIIMSAFMELHERRASFIFATHFYEIARFEEMEALCRIALKHLTVHYDENTGNLVYDRILKEGVGLTFYGLTVCRSMNMPEAFLERAFEIHRRHYPETKGVLSLKKSKYNRKKLVGICEICKKKFAEETHHIAPQKIASPENGYIDTFHKNHVANLMSLCSKCHKHAHLK